MKKRICKAAKQAEPSAPEDVVRSFLTAMNRWEREAWKADVESERSGKPQSPSNAEPLKQKLAIIKAHCTPKRRVYSRVLCGSRPAAYNPRTEKVVRVHVASSRRAAVYTQQSVGFEKRRRWVFHKRGGRWLIDNVQWDASEDKWERDIL